MARSVENTASSLMPLAEADERQELIGILKSAQDASVRITNLYNGIARQAFGPEATK